jgi:CCR4-NOT transcription complex subunit 3
VRAAIDNRTARARCRNRCRFSRAHREYLTAALSKLKEQIEILEFELESLAGKKKGKTETTRATQIADFIKRHKFHERALEKTLRMLENESVMPSQVEEMQEDLNYYLESNQEPDFFYDDEQIYEPVGLTTEDIMRQDDAIAVASRAAAVLGVVPATVSSCAQCWRAR